MMRYAASCRYGNPFAFRCSPHRQLVSKGAHRRARHARQAQVFPHQSRCVEIELIERQHPSEITVLGQPRHIRQHGFGREVLGHGFERSKPHVAIRIT